MAAAQRLFTCNDCSKAYTRNVNLQTHRRTEHLNDRPFRCEHCGKTFASADSCKKHKEAIHLRSKRYKCLPCGVQFTHQCTLKRHERSEVHRRKVDVYSERQATDQNTTPDTPSPEPVPRQGSRSVSPPFGMNYASAQHLGEQQSPPIPPMALGALDNLTDLSQAWEYITIIKSQALLTEKRATATEELITRQAGCQAPDVVESDKSNNSRHRSTSNTTRRRTEEGLKEGSEMLEVEPRSAKRRSRNKLSSRENRLDLLGAIL